MATEQDAHCKEVDETDCLDGRYVFFGHTGWYTCDMVVVDIDLMVWHVFSIQLFLRGMGVAD